MTTVLENQYHPPTGPLSLFFTSLDVDGDGFITKKVLHTLVEDFCVHHPLSFVQKKLLFVMLSQGFSRCASQKGRVTWNDIMVFAPKILLFFGQTTNDAQLYDQHVNKRFQELSNNSSTLPLLDLKQHCVSLLPRMCPNKHLLSSFLSHILCILCTPTTTAELTRQMWCDTALSIFFEVNAHK